MKSKYAILLLVLFISLVAFSQKVEIQAAEKALKEGESAEAVNILRRVEYLIANASDSEKADFYFVQGNALLDLANKNVQSAKNLSLAAKSFQELLAVEKSSGKDKYSSQAAVSIINIKYILVNEAIADSKIDKHSESAEKLYDAYLLDKNDTINLYYSASAYVNAEKFDEALKLYYELKALNYSGKAINYSAINKSTQQENLFNTEKERDLAIKKGTYENPKTEVVSSKKGEIDKNIALILIQNGKIEEAKKAIFDARKTNPDDDSLMISEANLYLKTKDFDTYIKLISEVLVKRPNDVDLIFNLGVISAEVNNNIEAEKYYKRVIQINPNYVYAYVNLASLKLSEGDMYNDEMNKLGNSDEEMKRYYELKNKKGISYKQAIPYLEKAVELDPENKDAAKVLLNVYNALNMVEQRKALEEKIKM